MYSKWKPLESQEKLTILGPLLQRFWWQRSTGPPVENLKSALVGSTRGRGPELQELSRSYIIGILHDLQGGGLYQGRTQGGGGGWMAFYPLVGYSVAYIWGWRRIFIVTLKLQRLFFL